MEGKLTGIIEGFYGREWPWHWRSQYAEFLKQQGFNSYIYAPKSDIWLRKSWRQPWPAERFDALLMLRNEYRRQGVNFGLGFSPFELYLDFNAESRLQLDKKIKQINLLSPDIFCVLFDDMRGDLPNLATTQLAIIDYIASRITATRLVVCPTYYSFDPVLIDVFGAMPDGYLQQLSAGLGDNVDIFWTGERVCSVSYTVEHLNEVASLLGRKPLIWDNYPVNDGRKTSRFLHLASPQRGQVLARSSGLFANPMNQPALSSLPLAGLSLSLNAAISVSYNDNSFVSHDFKRWLLDHKERFEEVGLDGLDKGLSASMLKNLEGFDEPAATEVSEWLREKYRFDPSCLTE
ncbi:hypothetical protein SIN8267_00240 [Sinobacterium norvegicum]|uniref:GH84 domain-containing protein n=1 Tax=Sinobacterium norvegicum TaxID=1641715 RepID=A0ABM9AAJ8_9GAMM|nr:beta-N-acetylglucosaminidase domain-containing protein [Sinobacterium norvegicum]CAH0990155.1 hypothetical protein SIN8267_00240 [Sinobacterium norvegicum]